ncbi:MAG: sulfatase-like hydrolase/transferase [Acidimicrobiia bacterium]
MNGAEVSRRSVLVAGAGGLAAATLGRLKAAANPAASRPSGRPNILWFISDDPSPYIGAYGDRVARTPTIDGLAREGILYETAYSPAPVCAPSRFGLITGMFAESAGPAQHMRANATLPASIRGFPEYLRRAGYYTTNNQKTDYNAPIDLAATWNESSGTAHWRNRPAGAPFFAQFTTLTPHESQLFDAPDGPTRPADVHVPPHLPDTPTVRRDLAHYYDKMARTDAELATRLRELDEDGLADDTIVFYFSDNGGVLPFSKRYANERGLRIPLVVRVPSKWSHLAPHAPGSRVRAPVHGVDLPASALAVAGVRVPAHMQGRALLGGQVRARRYTFGQRDRMDERYDLQRAVRDERYLYVRNYMPHRPYGQHNAFMWQLASYQEWEQLHLDGKLNGVQERFWGEKPAEELYDLRRDPDEVRNLIGRTSGGVPAVRDRLRRALDEHMLATNDNGFIPESHPLEGYAASRVPGAYPLRRVLGVAALAIQRNPGNLARLRRELRDDHDVVRFWAAQGLLMLGGKTTPAVPDLSRVLARDESVYVRIPVAEALARMGRIATSVPFLAETVDTHPNNRVRLQALNALTWVGKAALPYQAVVDRAAASDDEYLRGAGRYLSLVLAGTYTPTAKIYGS